MKIAIDVNDVLRDFTKHFATVYKRGYDHEFDLSEFELYTNDIQVLFPFRTPKAFEHFVYDEYAYEIFGSAPSCEKETAVHFNEWQAVLESEFDEPIDVTVISTMENGQTIQGTLFFLSKLGCHIRKYEFPKDSTKLWNDYDAIITANPLILDSKPKKKVSVKIDMDYNEDSKGDFHYLTASRFFKDTNNTRKIIDKIEKNNA